MNNLSIIESILYAVGLDGIEISDLKRVFDGIEVDIIRADIKKLQLKYENDEQSGFVIKFFGSKVLLLTKEENASFVAKLVHIKTKNPLTNALLETLAIIAYNQPCTKTKVQEIRKIDPSFAFEKLEELNLIQNIGRATSPGSPFLYQVTDKFFNLFGIKNIKQLPKLEDINFDGINQEDFFDANREQE